jgi:PAS domain S-box-containing protein
MAIVAVAVATLLRLWVDPFVGDLMPFPTFFIATMLAAWYGGLGPGILALIVGGEMADYLFVPPRGSVWLTEFDFGSEVEVGTYLCVGAGILALTKMLEMLHASRRKIEASEEKLRTVADFTYDWEYWESPEGEIVWMSPSCKRVTGYAAEEFLADRKLLETIALPDDRESVRYHRQEIRGSREPQRFELRIVTRNGEVRCIEHICQPVHGGDGRYLGRRINSRDVTERKRAEEVACLAQEQLLKHQQQRREEVEAELAKAKDQLIRQTRLAVIGQVSASIAHDIRNPLAAVRYATSFLKRRLPPDQPKCLEYVELIDQEIDETSRIISNLMEMAHGKQPKMERFDLGEAIHEVFDRLRHDAAVHLSVQLDPQPFVVAADPVQLRQVLGNLVSNAIQAKPSGGEIRIRASRQGTSDTIVVEDDGPGIPEELRGRIFEPLVTTKPKGTGLGLAICRQIMERHGGDIELLATNRAGATFQIRLPTPGDDGTGNTRVGGVGLASCTLGSGVEVE